MTIKVLKKQGTAIKAIAREIGDYGRTHYHLFLFFNKDRYYKVDDIEFTGTLARMMSEAWGIALGSLTSDYVISNRLLNIPENPTLLCQQG